jgi:hypothetical protein
VELKSVFALTSRIVTSSARCWKFAWTGKGTFLMTFASASLIDSNPNSRDFLQILVGITLAPLVSV